MSETVTTPPTATTSKTKRRTRSCLLTTAVAAAMSCAALTVGASGAQAMPPDCVQLRASIQYLAVDWTNEVALGNYNLAEEDGHLLQASLINYRAFGC